MAILITGAGIIGSTIARQLLERGERVVLIDVNPNHVAIGSVVGDSKPEIVTGDITDFDALVGLIRSRDIDSVIHTAAVLSMAILRDPMRGIEVNAMGTTGILEAARVLKLRRVVLASSTTLLYPTFGPGESGPAVEDFSMRAISQAPGTFYSATKLFNEHVMGLYIRQFGLDAVAVRYAAVLGDWDGPNNSVPGTLLRKFGEAIRARKSVVLEEPRHVWLGGDEFIDARDVATATIAALFAVEPVQRIYTIGNGVLSSFDDFVAAGRRIWPELEVNLAVKPTGGFAGFPHIRQYPSDISAAERELGFVPHYDLAASFARYVDPAGRTNS
jgi:UDP-glucose 4-epimerase